MTRWFVVLVVMTAVGCVTGGDDESDCRGICNAQENCVDPTFDAARCAENCEKRADDDDDFEDRVEACEECIAGRTCVEIGDSCDAICEGLRVD